MKQLKWILPLALVLIESCASAPERVVAAIPPENPTQTEITLSPKTDLSTWKLFDDDYDVKTYVEKHPSGNALAFRGETIMHVPLEKVVAALTALESERVIDEQKTLGGVEYVRTNGPWPYQDRDFVYRAHLQSDPATRSVVLSLSSVEDPRFPVKDGIVRGTIQYGYYLLKEVHYRGTVSTVVVVEVSADPKGYVPRWLVNLARWKWPRQTLNTLEQTARRGDVKLPPDFKLF